MFATPFGRILWKEYRVNRALWFSVLLMGFLFQLALSNTMSPDVVLFGILNQLPMLFSVMYAMGCSALLFSSEREERTSDWLLCLSVPPGTTLAGKLAFAVISTIALQLPLALFSVAVVDRNTRFEVSDFWWLWGPNALYVALWATLGSLTSRRVMVSIAAMVFWWIVTLMLPFMALQGVFWCIQPVRPLLTDLLSSGLHFTIIVSVLVADLWLGWRWCQGRYFDGSIFETINEKWLQQLQGLDSLNATTSRIPNRVEFDQSWRRTWQRLVWQERHRESLHRYFVRAACAVGLVCALADRPGPIECYGPNLPLGPRFMHSALLFCIGIPFVMGVIGFEFDASLQQPRFLCHRGISPAAVWLTKHVVWMSRAFLLTGIVFLLCLFFEWWIVPVRWYVSNNLDRFKIELPFEQMFHEILYDFNLAIWYILLSYGSGQLASSLLRRGILAFIFGVVLAAVATAWLSCICLMAPSARWLFLSFPVAFSLLVTLWQMKARMLELSSRRRQLTLGTLLVAMPTMLVFGLGWYRFNEVTSLPPLTLGSNGAWQASLAEQQKPTTENDRIVRDQIINLRRLRPNQDSDAADRLSELLKNDLSKLSIDPGTQGADFVWSLMQVLIDRADELARPEVDTKVERSLEYYLAGLKLARVTAKGGRFAHVWRGLDSGIWSAGSVSQYLILEHLVTWANHPSQSPASIRNAIKTIEAELVRFPSAADAIACSYLSDRKIVDDHSIEAINQAAVIGSMVDHPIQAMVPVAPIPWTWERLDLLMLREAEFLFKSISELETELATVPNPVKQPRNSNLALPQSRLPINRLLENATVAEKKIKELVLQRQAEIRAALNRMELIAYRLEHGKLPDRLIELMVDFRNFNALNLVDPYSGRLFDYYPGFLLSVGNSDVCVAPGGNEVVFINNAPMLGYVGLWDYRQFGSELMVLNLPQRYSSVFARGPVREDTNLFPIPIKPTKSSEDTIRGLPVESEPTTNPASDTPKPTHDEPDEDTD